MFVLTDVVEQLRVSLQLAREDAAMLARFGWPVTQTEVLASACDELVRNGAEYERKFGAKVGIGQDLRGEIDRGKRWREQGLAIGRNALAGSALEQLERFAGAAGQDGVRLAQQVQGILSVGRANDAACRAWGADDAFFAEGERLARSLPELAGEQGGKKKTVPAEHALLDEMEGRAWLLLKKLDRAGRAGHGASGDRLRAAAYNLDILYGRRTRARRPADTGTTPPAPTGSPR